MLPAIRFCSFAGNGSGKFPLTTLDRVLKFIQFAGSEPDEEYAFTVCGQTVLLCNETLASALSALPQQTQEVIFRYYFLRQPQRVIGVHIGRTRSTAGRHIQLALRRLREEMEVCRYE